MLLLEVGIMPWVIGAIAFILLMVGLAIVLTIGASRPHS